MDAYLFGIGNIIAVLVAVVNEIDGLLALILAEQIHILILIACGDEAFQSEKLEVIGKVCEEVRHARVIAVAQHRLSTKVFLIVAKLIIDVF
jgi:uncharacterized membrane protein